MKHIFKPLLILLFIVFSANKVFSQTIEQKLLVFSNNQTVGGNFVVDVQVKGTSLPSANTLGSATIDVQFDNSKISYQSADNLAFFLAEGYLRTATNNTTFIRVGVTSSVGPSQGTVGFDIGSSYVTWVRLHFQIISGGATSLTIASVSNQIGLYENHANNPETGVINDKTLTTPVTISNEPLPVELSSFSANANTNNISLSWKTATEVNNNGFEVQREVRDQKSEVRSQWEKIGFIQGHGNSNSPKEYSFTDKNLTGGTQFSYRLKQIDNDGKYEYSKEVEVEVVPKEINLLQNYPNPFNPVTEIKFTLPEAVKVTLKVYNIIGQEVASLVNGIEEAGFHSVKFGGSNLPSGTYIYRLQANSFVQTKKMVLLK